MTRDKVETAKVLFINPLHERHGSTVRARNLVRLIAANNSVSFVEPDCGKSGCVVNVNDKDSSLGLLQAVFEYLLACMRIEFDVLFLQKPMILTFPALLSAKFMGKRVIIDFDDLDSGWQTSKWKRALALFGEWCMPRFADAMTTHNKYLGKRIRQVCDKRIFLIPQGVDTDLFDPDRFDRETERKKIGVPDKRVFCFLGSFTKGSSADLDVVLKAFKEVSDQEEDLFLMIIGGEGPLEGYYLRMIKDLGLKNVLVTGRKDQKEIPRYLGCADYGLIFMRNNQANRCRVSLKLLEYLATGLTVIGHVVGGSRDAFSSHFFMCDPTVESLRDKMLEVLRNKSKRENPRDFIVKNYDWETFVPMVDEVINYCVA